MRGVKGPVLASIFVAAMAVPALATSWPWKPPLPAGVEYDGMVASADLIAIGRIAAVHDSMPSRGLIRSHLDFIPAEFLKGENPGLMPSSPMRIALPPYDLGLSSSARELVKQNRATVLLYLSYWHSELVLHAAPTGVPTGFVSREQLDTLGVRDSVLAAIARTNLASQAARADVIVRATVVRPRATFLYDSNGMWCCPLRVWGTVVGEYPGTELCVPIAARWPQVGEDVLVFLKRTPAGSYAETSGVPFVRTTFANPFATGARSSLEDSVRVLFESAHRRVH